MKKIARKKLGLEKETVRALTAKAISGVVGGYGNSAAAVACHSVAAAVCHSAAANVTCRLSANGAATCRLTL